MIPYGKLLFWDTPRWRSWQHLAFWLGSYVLLFRLMAYQWWPPAAADLVFVALFHVSLLVGVYLNLTGLIPYYLRPGRYILYAVGLLLDLALVVGLNLLIFGKIADWLVPGFYFITYYEWHQLVPIAFAYLGATTLLKLSKGWFREMQHRRDIQVLQREKLDAELKALRHQLNPHFLFNSLNNLYGLAQENDPRLADLLLKLSQVMRYPLLESGRQFVPLQRELAYLQDYIDLQRLRSEGQSEIRYEITGQVADQQIAPLLLLPFVENGFKHGIGGGASGTFVHITITLTGDTLIFRMENNLGKMDAAEREPSHRIGLQNTRKRLELLYPGRHSLETGPQEEVYRVQLKLELSATGLKTPVLKT